MIYILLYIYRVFIYDSIASKIIQYLLYYLWAGPKTVHHPYITEFLENSALNLQEKAKKRPIRHKFYIFFIYLNCKY